jgi:flagellar motor protein MotB
VQASVIAATGVAADQPVASNATAEGRAQNRRVELLIERTQ